jgi:hypothetical protein
MPDRERMLELALKGLEAERTNIDHEISQIKGELNSRPAGAKSVATASPVIPPKKKTMSAAARKKISEAMKRRYAAAKNVGVPGQAVAQVRKSESGAKQSTVKKENGGDRLSAAGRKKLSDLMKKRWAERRKGKAK